MAANYGQINTPNTAHSPYGSGDPYYNESSGYITPLPAKKRTSNWIKFGIPVLILVIIGAVVGGVVGSRHHNEVAAASGEAAASSAAAAQKAIGVFPTATDSDYMMPVYPSTTNSAAFTTPTFNPTTNTDLSWPQDPFQPSNPSETTVRSDRPRLIAPAYKWQVLPQLIQNNPYLYEWNKTIFGNASDYYNLPPVVYFMDGDSGILDNCRDVKRRMKAFGYVYRMTNDTKWVDRAWVELQNAAGNTSNPFGPSTDRWNSPHFLDTAEMLAAYGIAYDWMYDAWTSTQKSQIISTMIQYGLSYAQTALVGPDPTFIGWWKTNTTGNWNCVCNNGIIMSSLAILGDDPSGIAAQLISLAVTDANQNCVNSPTSDGTWSETADYWYFGISGHAEMTSSLMTATGSDYGLLNTNPEYYLTGMYHMFSTGPTSLFNTGDTGPNKYSSTANGMLFYATQYKQPQFALFQRDQYDAASDPWSMFWYDPTVSGAYWNGQPLDHFFDNEVTQWASMRSSWTDNHALYVAMKAGMNQGRQTHNDLDAGDFVLDALGTRWAGELGDGDYRSPDYFSNDTQQSARWMYYRKMTEGQNTILVAEQNQNVLARPSITYGSSNTTQGSSTVYSVPNDSVAYFVADLTSAYFNVTSFKRGIRTINGRKQVLLQDEITASANVQWRMHTNATVTVNPGGTSATLTMNDDESVGTPTLTMTILNPPSGVSISTGPAVRFPTDPIPPEPDQPNPGVTVVSINGMPGGTYNLQVLFNPQWPGMSSSDYKTPSSVALDSWTLTSHP